MFIVIDGPDGSGKSTVAQQLVQMLNNTAKKEVAQYTTDPTYSETGLLIRDILCRNDVAELSHLTRFFIEDRRNHVQEIQTISKRGGIVVCDRYYYSTVVYQHIQGEPISYLVELNKDFPKPDYTFILKAEHVDLLLTRILNRSSSKCPDFFETKERLQRAIDLYNDIPLYFPKDNIVFLSASASIDANIIHIMQTISRKL